MTRRAQIVLVTVATAIGAYLRFASLGVSPFWCDEAFFAVYVAHFRVNQEYLPGLIAWVLGTGSEFITRLPFALAGTLTIPAVYWIKPSKWNAYLSAIVATFPVFVIHSRMARPYAMAGLFVVLAWKYRWSIYAALLCTPVAIIGIDLRHAWRDKFFIVGAVSFAVLMYSSRGDLSRPGFGGIDMFLHSPRLWYLPILSGLLYLTNYALPWLEKRFQAGMRDRSMAFFGVAMMWSAYFLFQSIDIPNFKQGTITGWYTSPLVCNNWRGMPPVDLATNFTQIPEYYSGHSTILLRMVAQGTADGVATTDEARIYETLRDKDTILVGVDSYALSISRWFFPPGFIEPYARELYNGEVMIARIRRASKKEPLIIEMIRRPP